MKKIILVLLLLVGYSQAQDVSTTVLETYKDTLTATLDTMVVYFQTPSEYKVISIASTTGTDSVYVSTMDKNGVWVTKSLLDLTDGYLYSFMTVTTTRKEYIIYDPEIYAIRIRTPDASASSIFTVYGKREGR